MDVNNADIKDGDQTRSITLLTPSVAEMPNELNAKLDGSSSKKKRRRGKTKRKIIKPFMKAPWQDRRKNDKTKRNNRFRKIVLNKTQAPFNNNQFLMEIHKPEPENNFNRTTPARTRDSSFSIDSEDNYFFSLPEDEEEYLTKEFSSVYEDAQSERLSNMSKIDLIQEYLLLEAKYDNLMKRTERSRPRVLEEEKDIDLERDRMSDNYSTVTDKDTSGTSIESSTADEVDIEAIMRHVKEQENQIRELQSANEQLKLANEALKQRRQVSSSEDSESDSSTSSGSSSSSSSCMSPEPPSAIEMNGDASTEVQITQNGDAEAELAQPLVNGFHNPSDKLSD